MMNDRNLKLKKLRSPSSASRDLCRRLSDIVNVLLDEIESAKLDGLTEEEIGSRIERKNIELLYNTKIPQPH